MLNYLQLNAAIDGVAVEVIECIRPNLRTPWVQAVDLTPANDVGTHHARMFNLEENQIGCGA